MKPLIHQFLDFAASKPAGERYFGAFCDEIADGYREMGA